MLVRVNDYSPITDEFGVRKIQATTHGVRVNPSQVLRMDADAVTGYESDGETTINVFKVQLSGGMSIWTDGDGVDNINGWEFPILL